MKQCYINKLKTTLQFHFQWNKARIGFLLNFTTSLLICSTIKLNRIALFINTQAKSESNYRRIQNFFQKFEIDYQQYVQFVIANLPKKEKFYLVMDRTNWKFGKSDINILMLGVIYKKMCLPLYWILLDKRGSSSTWGKKTCFGKSNRNTWKTENKRLIGRQRVYRCKMVSISDRTANRVSYQSTKTGKIRFYIREKQKIGNRFIQIF